MKPEDGDGAVVEAEAVVEEVVAVEAGDVVVLVMDRSVVAEDGDEVREPDPLWR